MNDAKPYLVLSDDELSSKRRKNKYFSYFIYVFFFFIGSIVFYMYRIDKYEFYINKNEVLVGYGSSFQIELIPKNIMYFNALNYKYEILDTNIASVDKYGLITAKNIGTTELKIRYKNSFSSKSMKINVENIEVNSIQFDNNIQLSIDESTKINPTINNQDNIYTNIYYESGDTSVATIDEYGNVTAIGEGETKIIARSDNGITGEVSVEIEDNKNEIKSVRFNEESISVKKGSKTNLVAIIEPLDAINNTLTWRSDNDNVSVNSSGAITANEVGSSNITVTTSNGKTATCKVTVLDTSVQVSSVSLNATNKELKAGETIQLTATIAPSDATVRNITWSSNNTGVATVINGKVTAIKAGTAVITAKSSNGKTANCTIIVKTNEVVASSINLNITNTTLNVGGTINLNATINPINTTNKNITWSSSNSKVASVSNGKVTGVSIGSAVITAKSSNGKTASCVVVVRANTIEVSSVSISETNTSMYVGATKRLIVTINPSNATNKEITWSSSDSNIVVVDSNGLVAARNAGTAVITAKSSNGKTANCTITVKSTQFQVPLRTSDGKPLIGGDPYVIYKNGYYYYLSTSGVDIKISVSKNLQDIGKPEKVVTVWENIYNHVIWAPELHFIQGRWYIYFTNSTTDDYLSSRMFVLRSKTENPIGEYEYLGKICDLKHDYYALDGTVLEWEGQLYYLFSSLPSNNQGHQSLYIAHMSNPYTLDSERVLISSATYSWETISGAVNEGPEVLIKNGSLHIIYSASLAQSENYALGMLTYNGKGSLLSEKSWSKSSKPVFQSGNGVYGPGHASFTTSRDGTEDWIVYHAYANNDEKTISNWQRTIRIKKFTWNGTTPVFGKPDANDTYLSIPSGSI